MGSGILFVSPHREDATVVSRMLGSLPVSIEHVADVKRARIKMQSRSYEVILSAANLPDGTWLDVLDLAHRVAPHSEVIVTDRDADARFWAEALNLGAYDLIAQPFASGEVQRILGNACAHASAQHKTARAAV
jgi:two-component system, NtrC family, response regulator